MKRGGDASFGNTLLVLCRTQVPEHHYSLWSRFKLDVRGVQTGRAADEAAPFTAKCCELKVRSQVYAELCKIFAAHPHCITVTFLSVTPWLAFFDMLNES